MPLSLGLAGLIGVSLVNMFYPSSLLMNLSMYGGLMLFGAFVLYDIQRINMAARQKPTWDPINESMGIYLDAINIFTKFVMIFMSNKKK